MHPNNPITERACPRVNALPTLYLIGSIEEQDWSDGKSTCATARCLNELCRSSLSEVISRCSTFVGKARSTHVAFCAAPAEVKLGNQCFTKPMTRNFL